MIIVGATWVLEIRNRTTIAGEHQQWRENQLVTIQEKETLGVVRFY